MEVTTSIREDPEAPRLLSKGFQYPINIKGDEIQKMEHGRTMRNIVVPTAELDVRSFLRGLKQPVTLFGEGKLERRERLRQLLASIDSEELAILEQQLKPEPHDKLEEQKPSELFFTEGTLLLKEFRTMVAKFSIDRARVRLEAERHNAQRAANKAKIKSILKTTTIQASEVGDIRPLVACAFSPDDSIFATASWSGRAKLWNTETMQVLNSFQAHSDRLTSVAWHPGFGLSKNDSTVHLATGSVDGSAKLWTRNGTHLRTLEGHTQRLARIAMHPHGSCLGTCSFDRTWRLWDLMTGTCLLEQEGHSREVYAIAFQNDGSLVVSGGLDGYARLWDIRTGRSLTILKGHAKGILAVDFSPDGFTVATGSEDHSARIYDLRKLATVAVLPGHNSLISQVKFEKQHGSYLVTSGYDCLSKIWCGKMFTFTKELAGHDGMVMGSDTGNFHEHMILTAGYDRTVKLWEPEATKSEGMGI